MEFLEKERLLKILFEGVEELGGERVKRMFKRLVDEAEGQDHILSIEKALAYIFDRAGHPIMWHIDYRLAKREAAHQAPKTLENGYLLEKGHFIVETRKCSAREAFLSHGYIGPTEGLLCSLCKGYMYGVGEVIGFGNLVDVSHKEDACQFSFGGK